MNSSASPVVAVIDIGSNSIKTLIATRGPAGEVVPLRFRTVDARISAGISRADPRLSDAGMQAGLDAIQSLLGDAAEAHAGRIALVATSAVRDARNGPDFRDRVRAATGHAIRILTGDEEANLIGRGLTTDAALRHERDFYVFDLGGGSLECLAFRERRITAAQSFQLGCVRLTERFVSDAALPFSPSARAVIAAHTRVTLQTSGFPFTLPAPATAVGTGGTLTTARAILGARAGWKMEETPALVTVAQLEELLATLGALPLAPRQEVPGLPAARADVFPTALATLLAIAELGRFSGFVNSVHNLRYGLAAELLDAS